MTNREQLAASIGFSEYTDKEVAKHIADSLVSITDDEDCSIAVIYGNDLELLTEWLGKEAN